MKEHDFESHEALPLIILSKRVSPKTYRWLQDHEEREATYLDTLNENACSRYLFQSSDDDNEENDRVQEWISSSWNIDGVGGYKSSYQHELQVEDDALRVKYILSEAGGGHGDDLWAASRYISNIFANIQQCRELLQPLMLPGRPSYQNSINNQHPLFGLRVLELGAGAGLPSWTAMHCGAIVVCTDQTIPNRIRCLAESAERNMRMASSNGMNEQALRYADMVRINPYDWGYPVEDTLDLLPHDEENAKHSNRGFDVIVAADCIYMPYLHSILLDSIMRLLSQNGVAFLPFALHGNTEDDKVWNIINLAKEKGLVAEILESKQLTPQAECMDDKRALVHNIRLSWK